MRVIGAIWVALVFAFPLKSMADERPPPLWRPLTVANRVVTVTRRSYDFSGGPLPIQITVDGSALLAAPMALQVDGDSVRWQPPTVTESTPRRVSLLATGQGDGVRWQARVQVEYDGFVWVSVQADGGATIAHVSLLASMRLPRPPLFSHQLVRTRRMQPGWRAHFQGAPEKLWDAGRLPDGGWSGEFTPQLWAGDYRRGFAFVAESPQGWSVPDEGDILFLQRRGDHLLLRVDFVQQPVPLSGSWKVEFGFAATPMRPNTARSELRRVVMTGGMPLERMRSLYAPADMSRSRLNELARDGVRIVLLWNSWSDLWGFPRITQPEYAAFVRRFVDYAHRLGMQVVPYLGGFLQLPDNHPEWVQVRDRFLINRKDYHPDPFQPGHGSYRVTPDPTFTEWYARQLEQLVRDYGFDGVYLDTIAKPDFVLQKDRVVYAWRRWRHFFQRIYAVFHGGLRDDGIVYMHDSEPVIFPLNDFADLRLAGEMQLYAALARGEVRPLRPALRDRMTVERFTAWSSGQPLGDVPTTWTWKPPFAKSYSVGQGKERSSCRVEDIFSRNELQGLVGLAGGHILSPPRFVVQHSTYDSTVATWQLEASAEVDSMTWTPHWESTRYVRLEPDDDLASAGWRAPGKRLLWHVINLSDKLVVTRLVPTAASGLDGGDVHVVSGIAGDDSSWENSESGPLLRLGANSYLRLLLE